MPIKDLHFIGDGSDDVIQRDALAGGLTTPVGFAPAIENDFAAGFELFAEPVGDCPPFKDFGRGGIEVIVFIVVIDSAAIPADMNDFGLAAGAGLGESKIGEAANGADIGFLGIRVVRIIIWVLEFGIIEVRDVNFIKAAGRTALGAGLEGSITDSGFIIRFIEGRSFRDISAGSEGGEDKIHFLIHIAEDFAVDKLIENFLVRGGIGRIFVTVDGVKHKINFLFVCKGSGFKIGVVEDGGVGEEDIDHILIGFDVIAGADGIFFVPGVGTGVIVVKSEELGFIVEVLLEGCEFILDDHFGAGGPIRGGVAEVGHVLAGTDGETAAAGIKIIVERGGGKGDAGVDIGIDGKLEIIGFV